MVGDAWVVGPGDAGISNGLRLARVTNNGCEGCEEEGGEVRAEEGGGLRRRKGEEEGVSPPRARRDGPPLGQADGVPPQAAHVPRAVQLVVVLGEREEERRLRHARPEQRALAVHEVDDQALDALREALRPPGPALEEHDAPVEDARRVARRLARHGLAAVPGARAATDALGSYSVRWTTLAFASGNRPL